MILTSKITAVPTFTATIYAGFRVGRTTKPPEHVYTLTDAEAIIQKYVNENPSCVSVTPMLFAYTGGAEAGVAVGFINYPRFPSTDDAIKDKALALAELLRKGLRQMVVSVVFPHTTIMLSDDGSVVVPKAA